MAAGSDCDVPWKLESDAAGFSWECFDKDRSAAVSSGEVKVKEAKSTCDAFSSPNTYHDADVGQSRELGDFQVNIHADDSQES